MSAHLINSIIIASLLSINLLKSQNTANINSTKNWLNLTCLLTLLPFCHFGMNITSQYLFTSISSKQSNAILYIAYPIIYGFILFLIGIRLFYKKNTYSNSWTVKSFKLLFVILIFWGYCAFSLSHFENGTTINYPDSATHWIYWISVLLFFITIVILQTIQWQKLNLISKLLTGLLVGFFILIMVDNLSAIKL